jgi:hypothetical protein
MINWDQVENQNKELDNSPIHLPVYYSNLSPKDRIKVREQYIKEQGGKCFWCKCSLELKAPSRILIKPINWSLFPKGFLNYPIHLQHSRKTGLTEGAVHNSCNAVMWQYYKI